MSEVLYGTVISRGIVIGPAIIQQGEQRIVPRYYVGADSVEKEQQRLEQAFEAVNSHLEKMKKRMKVLPNHDPYLILDAHQSLLMDDSFHGAAFRRIAHQRINAEWSIEQTVGDIRQVFDKVEDTYFRSRLDDILNLNDLVLAKLDGARGDFEDTIDAQTVLDRAVLVARNLSPHATLQAIRSGVRAIVLAEGNHTDHSAIIARSMGIPMMIQVPNLLESVSPGQQIAFDGDNSQLILSPTLAQVSQFTDRFAMLESDEGLRWAAAAVPSVTRDGTPVAILANVDLPEEMGQLKMQAVHGVGLFRTEIPYLGQRIPDESVLVDSYRRMYEICDDKEIVFRLLDLGGDKLPTGELYSEDMSSPLGLRGIRFLFEHQHIMRTQVRAIVTAAEKRKVKILLPMIVDQREVRRARAIIDEVLDSLALPSRSVQVGCMIETPSAAITVDHLAKVSDFFSVGTNDLLQFTLVADRNNASGQMSYDPYHPAVLRVLASVFRASGDVPVTLCGELAGDRRYLPLLLGMGARSLSMSLPSVPEVKQCLRNYSIRECKALYKSAGKVESSAALEALLDVFEKRHPLN